MTKAVIFDLDGTLLDTVDSMAAAGNRMLEQLGLAAQPACCYRYFAGDGSLMLVRRALQTAGGMTDEASVQAAHQIYLSFFAHTCTQNVRPYPGIMELLCQLHKHGILSAVLSNKPHAQTVDVVARFFDPNLFAVVRGQQEGVPLKPNPQAVRAILTELSLAPNQCLYVGDTAVDMQTGQNAGIATAGAVWGFRGREELVQAHADYLAQTPLDLLTLALQ